jgi:hypothetical protein
VAVVATVAVVVVVVVVVVRVTIAAVRRQADHQNQHCVAAAHPTTAPV